MAGIREVLIFPISPPLPPAQPSQAGGMPTQVAMLPGSKHKGSACGEWRREGMEGRRGGRRKNEGIEWRNSSNKPILIRTDPILQTILSQWSRSQSQVPKFLSLSINGHAGKGMSGCVCSGQQAGAGRQVAEAGEACLPGGR